MVCCTTCTLLYSTVYSSVPKVSQGGDPFYARVIFQANVGSTLKLTRENQTKTLASY